MSYIAPMPPHHQYRGFLPEGERAALLDWALTNRDRFRPTKVFGSGHSPEKRLSERLRDFGGLEPILQQRFRDALPDILRNTGSRAFEPDLIELELVAHGDGAHFKPHIDLQIGPDRKPVSGDGSGVHERLVSGVYYFHREPKGFSGGNLRLHRFGTDGGPGNHVDLEPEQNSFAVFPSWAPHEVRMVSCPSGRFEDSRFAVNAWYSRNAA